MLIYEDDLVDELDEMEAARVSEPEDECESEENMLHPFERRRSLTGLTPYDSTSGCHISPDPFPPALPRTDDMVERLQMEMADLRRESSDAKSLSMRLSDQLAQAQSDVSKAESDLRKTLLQLEDETMKRRQAERRAEEALRSRHVAEEALKSLRHTV
jgi:vacuolar-type H+-ATPase subunit I/STV1